MAEVSQPRNERREPSLSGAAEQGCIGARQWFCCFVAERVLDRKFCDGERGGLANGLAVELTERALGFAKVLLP